MFSSTPGRTSSRIPSQWTSLLTALTKVFISIVFSLIYNLISIPAETDQTDEMFETAEVEKRSTAETELDLPTELLGKMIDII